MRALVVYESMFGNTKQVAAAIADGLGAAGDVQVVEVGDAPSVVGEDVDLVVVGGPTHAFGMSRDTTRRDAVSKTGGPVISARGGVREWLEQVTLPPGVAAAAFGSRVSHPRLPGRASRGIAKRLSRLGCRLVAGPEDFYVGGMTGPLDDGELDRARGWASAMVTGTRV